MFFLTFTVGDFLKGYFEMGLEWFSGWVSGLLESAGAFGWLRSRYHTICHCDIEHISLRQYILDGVVLLLAGGDSVLLNFPVHAELMDKVLLLVLGHSTVTLDAQVYRLLFLSRGLLTLSEQIGQDLISSHVGIAVGVG